MDFFLADSFFACRRGHALITALKTSKPSTEVGRSELYMIHAFQIRLMYLYWVSKQTTASPSSSVQNSTSSHACGLSAIYLSKLHNCSQWVSMDCLSGLPSDSLSLYNASVSLIGADAACWIDTHSWRSLTLSLISPPQLIGCQSPNDWNQYADNSASVE